MEIKVEKPKKYVDSRLFTDETGFAFYQLGDNYFLAGDATESELLAALEAHNPTPPQELSVADKLASVGLSLDDLKAALGI
jgi:hypothetical protein